MQHHHCELSSSSDFAFPTLPPNSPKWVVWSRKLRVWCSISNKHPRCRQHFASMAAVAFERRRQARLSKWWIIHPFSQARFIWEMVMLVIYSIAFVTIPFMTCFYVLDYNRIRLDGLNLFIYAFCWVDIILNLITGFYNNKEMEIVLHQGRILKFYIKGYLFIDILTSLPYDHITLSWRAIPGPGASLIVPLVNLLPMLKLTRCWTLKSCFFELFTLFGIKHLTYKMCMMILLFLYTMHIAACICYVAPVLAMYVNQMNAKDCTECWLAGVEHETIHERYHHALFAVSETVTASGFGIFPPKHEGHSLVCTILMLFGRLFEAYIIIIILQIKAGWQTSDSKFDEIMNQLSSFMRQKQLPPYMQHRLIAYYQHRFRNSYFREKLVLSSLSDHLRQEIVQHSCRHLIENVTLFENMPKHVLSTIVANLKLEFYLPNDVIVKAGTQGDCMFFLSSGTVAVLTPTGKEVCHLEDGAYFGEVALLVHDQRRVASVVAVEVCEVYRLDRRNFRKCIAVCSDLFAKIEREATDRMERTVLIEEQHKRFLMKRISRSLNVERKRKSRNKSSVIS